MPDEQKKKQFITRLKESLMFMFNVLTSSKCPPPQQ